MGHEGGNDHEPMEMMDDRGNMEMKDMEYLRVNPTALMGVMI